ncbi:putative major facilitator superfamily transporter protein [Botrytis cinerea BcDW1]|nr:putative major facilitator superfamily transporter protein [Botrytis cinerea BcDW1]
MAESNHQAGGPDTSVHTATENTPLLFPSRNDTPAIEEVLVDNDGDSTGTDVDPNEFDLMLSRTTSFTAIGIETNAQESSMLRSSRIHHHHTKRGSRNSSRVSTRRKSISGSIRSIRETIEDDDEEPKSPFLGGVGVKRFWLIFGGVLLTYTLSSFDSTIMVSSHPVITSYFHASNSASWLSTAFLLTSTSFQPIFGRLSDAMGRKPPYIFSMILFLVSTIWCALAQSMTSFIIARAVCGLGAGGVMSMGSIITSDLIPIEIRGAYQSYLNIVFGVGAASGAALGGAIADHLGWRWEFGVQVPGLILCLIVSCFVIPNDLGLNRGKKTLKEALSVFDYKGSLLLMATITFFILAINLGGNIYPWTHPLILTCIILTVIGLPLFIITEHYAPQPVMPLSLITNNPRGSLIIGNALGAIVINAVLFNIPLFFQAVLLESPTASGLRLIIPSIAASAIGTLTGFLITWTRNLKTPLVLGVSLYVIGTIGLVAMNRSLPNWVYVLLLIPSSMGQGFQMPGSFMSVLAVSEQGEQAVVTTTLVLWRSMGQVLGVAVSSLIVQNSLVGFLNVNVVGPDKEKVIEAVRSSVQAVAGLEPHYRDQVIDSYAEALRAAYVFALAVSILSFGITIGIKLPKLGFRK